MDTATDSKNDKDKEKKKFGDLLVERYMECLLDPKDSILRTGSVSHPPEDRAA